jgi:hypothetical protein
MNEPSFDAPSITLTVSAFAEIDMPTTIPKISMADLMVTNDLETNFVVMSWYSCEKNSSVLPQNIHLGFLTSCRNKEKAPHLMTLRRHAR